MKSFAPLRSRSSKSCPSSLLEKRLRPYFASNRQADRLTFKDAFRHAAKHDLISVEARKHWFAYQDNRNDTAHDYGEKVRGDDAQIATALHHGRKGTG